MIPGVVEQALPPREERLSLAEAGDLFDPPRSKKAVEQLVHRGSLDFARELGEEGQRARRVVTTRAWLESYVEASGGKARLREEREEWETVRALAQVRAEPEPESAPSAWRTVMNELAEENLRLRLRIAQLGEELRRRSGPEG
jgi:hypothetical protein